MASFFYTPPPSFPVVPLLARFVEIFVPSDSPLPFLDHEGRLLRCLTVQASHSAFNGADIR